MFCTHRWVICEVRGPPTVFTLPFNFKGKKCINLAWHSLDVTNSKLLISFDVVALNVDDRMTQNCSVAFGWIRNWALSKALSAKHMTTGYEQYNKLMECISELWLLGTVIFIKNIDVDCLKKITLWLFVLTHVQMATQTQSCDWLTFFFVLLTQNLNSTQN